MESFMHLSDLDLPLTMEFNDIISFSGLLGSPTTPSPTTPRDYEKENSVISSQRQGSIEARDAAEVVTDGHHHLEVTKCQTKRRKLKHNFSEKKRRERIQAQLKLLRELIPNSQKLDSASLLEEAISHIKALICELQMMQEMRQFPYTNVPPYNLRFTGTTPMSPFVPPNRPNIMITGMNGNFTTIPPPLFMPLPPQFPAAMAGNVIPVQLLPPNPYCYDQLPGCSTAAMQLQLQAMQMQVHASYQKEMNEGTLKRK